MTELRNPADTVKKMEFIRIKYKKKHVFSLLTL